MLTVSMNLYIIFVALFISTTSQGKIQGRVFGGSDASSGTIPWQLSLRRAGRHVCSASLIKSKAGVHFALTTASCLQSRLSDVGDYPYFIFTLVGGRVDINVASAHEQERNATYIWVNWRYYNREKHFWDICVLPLSSNFDETDYVAPVRLPINNQKNLADGLVQVSGWGYHKDQEFKDNLQVTTVQIVEHQQCKDQYYRFYRVDLVYDNSSCAGNREKSACIGDEGSPAVAKYPEGEFYLWGIFQWTHGKCPDSYWPGIYVDVAKHLSWIEEQFTRKPRL